MKAYFTFNNYLVLVGVVIIILSMIGTLLSKSPVAPFFGGCFGCFGFITLMVNK